MMREERSLKLKFESWPPIIGQDYEGQKGKSINAELSKIVGPVEQKLTRSDLNFFASDPMSGAIFQ
jgi:hypothetical protein